MDDIRAALRNAAGADEPPLDLDALRSRAGTRQQRRRAGLACLAACTILVGATAAWAMGAGGSPEQRLRAGQSADDPSESTTSTVPESTSSTLVSTTGTTATIETTGPSSTTTTTTAPVTPPSTSLPPGSSDVRSLRGTHLGAGRRYEPERNGCASLSHKLDSVFTLDGGEAWTYHADYCGVLGRTEDDRVLWSGEGNFTFTTPTGDTVTGSFTSKDFLPSKGAPYALTVTGGTGAWAGAQGTCHLTNRMRDLPSGLQEQAGEFTCEIQAGAAAPGGEAPTDELG